MKITYLWSVFTQLYFQFFCFSVLGLGPHTTKWWRSTRACLGNVSYVTEWTDPRRHSAFEKWSSTWTWDAVRSTSNSPYISIIYPWDIIFSMYKVYFMSKHKHWISICCDYTGYESVFDKKAFGSELEVIELESFFKECDMYPSASEIDEAIDVVFHGEKNVL